MSDSIMSLPEAKQIYNSLPLVVFDALLDVVEKTVELPDWVDEDEHQQRHMVRAIQYGQVESMIGPVARKAVLRPQNH